MRVDIKDMRRDRKMMSDRAFRKRVWRDRKEVRKDRKIMMKDRKFRKHLWIDRTGGEER